MSVCAVIVTFNRINDLKKCLEKYSKQTKKIDGIIVVNNCSNDGTKEYLEKWVNIHEEFNKNVLNLPANIGGSGGFYEGLKFALKFNYDWLWLHDDDAFLYDDTIENLYSSLQTVDSQDASAICGMVMDGEKIAFDHRRTIKKSFFKTIDKNISEKEYTSEKFELNAFSYVGVAINVEKLLKVGLTNKDFFIFLDDTEHSYRLSKVGKIICFPKVKILHENKYQNNNSHKATWKLYYSIRNNIYFHKYCLNNGTLYWTLYFYSMAIFKLIFRKDKIGYKLVKTAIKDGLNKNMGKNKIYAPGWKAE